MGKYSGRGGISKINAKLSHTISFFDRSPSLDGRGQGVGEAGNNY